MFELIITINATGRLRSLYFYFKCNLNNVLSCYEKIFFISPQEGWRSTMCNQLVEFCKIIKSSVQKKHN